MNDDNDDNSHMALPLFPTIAILRRRAPNFSAADRGVFTEGPQILYILSYFCFKCAHVDAFYNILSHLETFCHILSHAFAHIF